MIKEIMLASAFLSNTIVPVEYELWNNNVVANCSFNVGDIRINGTTNLCINLNDGTFFTCNFVESTDGAFTIYEINNIDDSNSVNQPLNYYDYMKYIVNTFSPFHNGENGLLYTNGTLDFYFDIYYDNQFDLSNEDFMEDAHLNYFLGTHVINNNIPYFIKMTNDYSYSIFDENHYMRGTNVYFDNLVGGLFDLDNLYIIIQFREVYFDDTFSDNYYLDFDINFKFKGGVYIELSNIDYPDLSFYSNDTYYNEFIYQSIDELESENIILSGQNDYLRRENEELNSKHVFANTFELIRGAMDGVINFLDTELISTPRITIGMLMFIPVVVGVIWFILKALVL